MQATKETVQKRPHTALWISLCVVLLCAAGAALYFCRWAEKPLTLAEENLIYNRHHKRTRRLNFFQIFFSLLFILKIFLQKT